MIAMKKYRVKRAFVAKGDVWAVGRTKNCEGHPACFPVVIPKRIIAMSECNDVVLDPFMGSGTTAIAALKCGVSFVGIDNSPKYCKIARQRIKDHVRQGKML